MLPCCVQHISCKNINVKTNLVCPVHLLVVEVAQVRVEAPLAGDVVVGVAADVPLADHVRLVPGILHVLREDLSAFVSFVWQDIHT